MGMLNLRPVNMQKLHGIQLHEGSGRWGEPFAALRIKFSYGARLRLTLFVRVSIVSLLYFSLFFAFGILHFTHTPKLLTLQRSEIIERRPVNMWTVWYLSVTPKFYTRQPV